MGATFPRSVQYSHSESGGWCHSILGSPTKRVQSIERAKLNLTTPTPQDLHRTQLFEPPPQHAAHRCRDSLLRLRFIYVCIFTSTVYYLFYFYFDQKESWDLPVPGKQRRVSSGAPRECFLMYLAASHLRRVFVDIFRPAARPSPFFLRTAGILRVPAARTDCAVLESFTERDARGPLAILEPSLFLVFPATFGAFACPTGFVVTAP